MATKVHSRNQNGPVPDRLYCKFNFIEDITQSAMSGIFQGQYAANDIFNCFIGDTDSWANYFPQYARLYSGFRVYASKIKLHIWVKADQTQEFVVFILPWYNTSSTNDPASMQNALSFPNERHVVCTPLVGTDSYHCLEHYMEAGSLQGVRDIADDGNYQGNFMGPPNWDQTSPAASPATVEAWKHFAFATQVSAPAQPSYTYITEIEYYCELFGVRPADVNPDPEFTSIPKALPKGDDAPEDDKAPDLSDSVLVDRIVKAVKAAK